MEQVTEQVTGNIEDDPVILTVDTAVRSAFSAVLCGVFGSAMAYLSVASYFHLPGFVPVGVFGLMGGIAIGMFFVWAAVLNAWRFFGPDYDALVSVDGLTLHPSVTSRRIGWDEVSASRVVSKWIARIGTRTVIELELTSRVRGLANPFGSKFISIVHGRPSYPRQMKDVARLIRKYRLAAGWRR